MSSPPGKKKAEAKAGSNLHRRIRDVDATAHLPRELSVEGSSLIGRGTVSSFDPGIATGSEIPENITVFLTPDKIFIRSQSRTENCIVVDRRTEQIRVDSASSNKIPVGATKRTFFGLLGQIRLFGSTYLIVISRRRRIGREAQHTVWKLTGVNFVKVKDGHLELRQDQEEMNSRIIYLLIQLLTEGEFIFAYTFDFTHTVQRLHGFIGPDNLTKPIYTRGERRFIWNDFLTANLVETEGLAAYLVPLMRGYFTSNKCHLNGQDFTLMLVSRVGVARAGVRYFTRGLDLTGNIANYVETEIVLETPKDRFSFVQTRSSPPLIWEQRPDLSYNPKPKVKAKDNNMAAFTHHFDVQCKIYGPHVLLDILNRTGFEGYIADFYSHIVVRCGSNRVRYVPLPFKNVQQMLTDLDQQNVFEDLMNYGFVMVTGGRKIISTQKGIVRTTGYDSVDRTNAVQCLISSLVLREMLIRAGVFKKNDELEYYGKLKKIFHGMWADNGDALSQIYCGSPSLASESLRLSSRHSMLLLKGIKHWYTFATRYYVNNFSHGPVQDALDVLTGRFIPTDPPRTGGQGSVAAVSALLASESNLELEYSEDVATRSFFARYVTTIVPVVLSFTFSNFVVFMLQVGENPKGSLLCSSVWLILSGSIVAATVQFLGRFFVKTPKFIKRRMRRYL